MTIDNAAELHTTWAARFNAKDLDGMLALAEAGSVFVPQPGVVVDGDGVRSAEQQFLSMGLPITLNVRRVIVSGDKALLISRARSTGTRSRRTTASTRRRSGCGSSNAASTRTT